MIVGLFLGAVRQGWQSAFRQLPPLDDHVALPSPAGQLRYSLLHSLRPMRREVPLFQMGDDAEASRVFLLGHSVLQPALADILIRNAWVVPGDRHWVEAIVVYRLSAAGLAVEQQLEAWWQRLTLDQRLRAALLE